MNTQHALPPYAEMLGVTLEPRDGAAPLLVMPFRNEVLGRPGFLHGGAISGLLEVAAIVSLQHALAEEGGGRIKPVNVTVDFMRGGRDKPTHAEGIVTRLGTRVANVEAIAWRVFRHALIEVIQPREWRQALGIRGPGKGPVAKWAVGQWPELAGRTQDEIDAAAIACAALRKVEVVA